MKKRNRNSKNILRQSLGFGSASLSLALALLANNNATAGISYWDPTGTTVSATPSGNWEGSTWSSSAALTASPSAFIEGNLAAFAAGTGATGSYTVTAAANHTIAGIFNGALSDSVGSVTINGPGILSLASGLQGFDTASGGNTIINAVLGGTGGVENQGSGSLYLYGDNTYSGGTTLDTSAGLNFNNNNSFGTGTITWAAGTTVLATPTATGPLTIANNVTTVSGTQIFVGIAAAPVTFSGNWTLPATGTSTFQNQPAGTTVTISGVISGAATFTKAGAGTLVLSGANTHTGPTKVSAGPLMLGAANTIATSSQVILAGGTLNPGGFNQAMSGTLSLTASSTIDFGAGAATVNFADSHSVTWTGTLNVNNYSASDALYFGTTSSGLTAPQLADIDVDGVAGVAYLTSSGELVPEPSSVALGIVGGLGLLLNFRRRKA